MKTIFTSLQSCSQTLDTPMFTAASLKLNYLFSRSSSKLNKVVQSTELAQHLEMFPFALSEQHSSVHV